LRILTLDSAKTLDSELVSCLSLYSIVREPCCSVRQYRLSALPPPLASTGIAPCLGWPHAGWQVYLATGMNATRLASPR